MVIKPQKKVPVYIWLIIFFSILCPIYIPEPSIQNELFEFRWFLLLVPVFFISYYFGLSGGIIYSLLSNILLLIWEWGETQDGEARSSMENYLAIFISIVSLSIATGIGLLTKQLYKLTIKDPLTNSFNRRYIDLHKTKKQLSILFIDLDRFKLINDSLGHRIGDKLLQSVSERLKKLVKGHDILVRFGGDEFIIILHDIKMENSKKLAEQILTELSFPYLIEGNELYLTASIGISKTEEGEQENDINELIVKADIAMYQAKRYGKNQYQLYAEEMNRETTETVEMENHLHRALESKEFILYYQPKVDLKTSSIIGMEALIRWKHPNKGLIAPLKFISLAEETGIIVPIGEWVLETACKQNKEWQDAGFPPMIISVNISARQFQDNLVGTINRILNETRLDPHWLELEITESVLIGNIDKAIQTLMQLKRLGVHISIDDFGTGFSSLNYLMHFPIDVLKIDKSFVDDIVSNSAIAKSIITLGHNLNIKVIAEGIEEQQQANILASQKCDYGQGFLYSPPLSKEKFEQKLRSLVEKDS